MVINSDQNRDVRHIMNLKKKKYRDEKEAFFMEGLRAVEEALLSKVNIDKIVVSDSFMKTEFFKNISELYSSTYKNFVELVLLVVNEHIFSLMSETETPQGIGAVLQIPHYRQEQVIKANGNYLLLENLQDPGNMGTIIRTADAAGFDGILCTKGCVDVYNSKVLRSTVGSIFHIPVVKCASVEGLAPLLKTIGLKLYAAHITAGTTCFEQEFSKGSVILIGNEANGLTKEALDRADCLVSIPMPGKAESLNASIAAALLMYEVVRKASSLVSK